MSGPLKPEELLTELIQSLADKPEAVRVDYHEDSSMVTFNVSVDKSDVGKVIGSRGCYANAMRLLFGAIYGKLHKTVFIRVGEHRPGR